MEFYCINTRIYLSNINIHVFYFLIKNYYGCVKKVLWMYCGCVMDGNKSLPEAIRKIIKTLNNASGEFNVDWRYSQYMHIPVQVTVLCTCKFLLLTCVNVSISE